MNLISNHVQHQAPEKSIHRGWKNEESKNPTRSLADEKQPELTMESEGKDLQGSEDFKRFFKLDEIKECLKGYGLNPNDWVLARGLESREAPLMLTHKKDGSFKLLAFLDWQERPVVKDLCVYSI